MREDTTGRVKDRTFAVAAMSAQWVLTVGPNR